MGHEVETEVFRVRLMPACPQDMIAPRFNENAVNGRVGEKMSDEMSNENYCLNFKYNFI